MDEFGDRLADRLAEEVRDVSWEQVRAAVDVATTWRQRRRELLEAAEADLSWLRSGSSASPFASRALIGELTRRGAHGLVLPRCLLCGLQRPLENLHEGGRICGLCRARRDAEPCAGCGKTLAVSFRDPDDGRPFCRRCREKDPAGWTTCGRCGTDGRVTAFDEGVPICPRCYQAPVKPCGFCDQPAAIARHITIAGVGVPACSRCGTRPLGQCTNCGQRAPVYGIRQRLPVRCGRCWHANVGDCPRCRRRRHLIEEQSSGLAVCEDCYTLRRRRCGSCGVTGRAIKRKGVDGEADLCLLCWRGPMVTCVRCGQLRRCPTGRSAGTPACALCVPKRPARCDTCGEMAAVAEVLAETVHCRPCYHARLWQDGQQKRISRRTNDSLATRLEIAAEPDGWHPSVGCADCGGRQPTYCRGRCWACLVALALDSAITDEVAADSLRPWCSALLRAEQLETRWRWLAGHEALITALGSGAIAVSHPGLDSLPRSRIVERLRSELVATGCLPSRPEQPAAFDRWLVDFVDQVGAAEDKRVLQAYGKWRLLPRMRRRAARQHLSYSAFQLAKTRTRAAAAFLGWLRSSKTSLAAAGQADIDEYLSLHPKTRPHLQPFIRWAAKNGHSKSLQVVRVRSHQPKPVADADERWVLLRRFLHDDDIALADRVAGGLILLYGQPLSRLLALPVDAVDDDHDEVRIRFVEEWVTIQEPLGALTAALKAQRHHPRAILRDQPSRWLFPGVKPDQAASHAASNTRLRKLGLLPGPGRARALIHHAQRTEAPILARLLGISPATAQIWSERAGNEFGGYVGRVAAQGKTL